jgi:hypothetical protein
MKRVNKNPAKPESNIKTGNVLKNLPTLDYGDKCKIKPRFVARALSDEFDF